MPGTALQRNNVRVLGTGSQPMIFAHGYGCDQHMWRFITPAFQRDYQLILFDHVGAGQSDLSAYNYNPTHLSAPEETLAAMRDYLS
jgi:sigma-B regulation protein RsbQ